MKLGMVLLCAAYVLSQFFRAFLAVLTNALERDVGATPDDLAFASGMWFLVFALMQLPIGEALDRVGPRRTAAILLALGGGGGAAIFALATTPVHISVAMALIGVGCSPVLMASYYIFARMFPPAMFATLGAAMIGVGSIGNLASAAPLAWAIEAFGWRESLWALSAISVLVAVGVWAVVQDPPRAEGAEGGSVLAVLKIPALWLILPLLAVNYAPAAGLRGLWVGPYLSDVYGATAQVIGTATLIMGLVMVVAVFVYGPLDRLFGTRKWVVVGGNTAGIVACGILALTPEPGYWPSVILCAAIAMFGLSYPVIMAHGRSFLPPHLTGRGVTLMNLFSIGGVGLFQVITGRLYSAAAATTESAVAPYQLLFGFFAAILALGMIPYLFSRDRLD
ncbi:Predicted arabinose efflux permease, MFS family [Lutimaribacter pacificus]|uniref:Predicted arabinose efflux permease, MFS family n=1 Tax=Lutimaribacter pacificus TaxID=391948 RepID=A0A1H0GU75_9RHOB|nr:MFS transporter [Lutimaribacter pacificus]SDO10425.1 Predicted arabinose efflux permease, MFS family [Lutimaribacter pacificus]SHJ91935.1 Predicted arabinose efflux permease, MFS family [Lutimaribacter pacificus]